MCEFLRKREMGKIHDGNFKGEYRKQQNNIDKKFHFPRSYLNFTLSLKMICMSFSEGMLI